MIDAPGGGGKIPILPKYILHKDDKKIIMRNYKHNIYSYNNLKDEKKNNIQETAYTGSINDFVENSDDEQLSISFTDL
jgi:hypothetical protein